MQKQNEIWFTLEPGDRMVIPSCWGNKYYRFRQDPVPGYSWGWKNSPRHYRTAQERRAYADPDIARYARPRRMRELDAVFDVYRVSERSWKAHRQHQWKE